MRNLQERHKFWYFILGVRKKKFPFSGFIEHIFGYIDMFIQNSGYWTSFWNHLIQENLYAWRLILDLILELVLIETKYKRLLNCYNNILIIKLCIESLCFIFSWVFLINIVSFINTFLGLIFFSNFRIQNYGKVFSCFFSHLCLLY